MAQQNNTNTIAKNTFFLYVRLLLTVFINFFTSRIVLQVLGVEDFGLYNVVGSVVAMFTFLNSGMVQASQRFMSYEMGRGDEKCLKDVFSSSFLIHILIALIVFVAVESVGIWFLNNRMNISPERLYAANWVLQCSLLSFSIQIVTVPFLATIIAHERMGIYAIIGFVDALLKLVAIYIVKYTPYDNLISYSILLLIVPLLEFLVYSLYNKRHFSEVSFRPRYIKSMFRGILSFAGWSFVGNIGFVFRGNGVNIVINLFCGTAVNAARGIASQVSSQLVGFTSNFQMAIIPQITKRYAAQEYTNMLSLVMRGSKFSFILLFIIALPFCLRADYVLTLWLGIVPQYTVEFVNLILIMSLIDGMAIPLGKAIDATGNIKWFQTSIAIVMLLDIPFAYILLWMGVVPYLVVISSIIVSILGLLVRIYILKRRFAKYPVVASFNRVFLRCLFVSMVAYYLCVFINDYISNTFLGLIIMTVLSIFISCTLCYFFALDNVERDMIIHTVKSKIHINKND